AERAREQHAAGILGLAQAAGDLAERQLLELAEQDDLAVRVAQAFHGLFEPFRPLVADHARQDRGDARLEVLPAEWRFALRAAPRALMVVGAVEDLALRDAGEPRHQRRFAGALEL